MCGSVGKEANRMRRTECDEQNAANRMRRTEKCGEQKGGEQKCGEHAANAANRNSANRNTANQKKSSRLIHRYAFRTRARNVGVSGFLSSEISCCLYNPYHVADQGLHTYCLKVVATLSIETQHSVVYLLHYTFCTLRIFFVARLRVMYSVLSDDVLQIL